MPPIPCFQVDAFTDRPFAGNPAAVCILDQPQSDQWMQALAAEMNLSETAYVRPLGDAFELRWFTPSIEVELCGHATLASAHVLWSELGHSAPTILFQTASGTLSANRSSDWIELDFPATPAAPVEPPEELLQALGVQPSFVGRSKFDKFIVVDTEQTVRSLRPDFQWLRRLNVRGVIVTSESSDPEFDFVSRYFAPAAGIDEDPVTGSAHCCLAPYWAQRLGKSEMVAYQASPRGGIVRVRLAADRVILSGQAITIFRGSLSDCVT